MNKRGTNRIAGALCALAAAAMLAGTAWAISYLKSDDKVILNDGTEVIGSIIFRADTMVVIMVDGQERHIDMTDVKKIEMAEGVSGMVESTEKKEPKGEKKSAAEEEAEGDAEPEADEEAKPEEKKAGEAPEEKAGGHAPEETTRTEKHENEAVDGTPAPEAGTEDKDGKEPGGE